MGGKENDPAVRTACLDLCHALYVSLGSDLLKLMRLLGDQALGERITSMVKLSYCLLIYLGWQTIIIRLENDLI